RRALGLPEVRRVLEEKAAADIPAALEGSDQGRAFLADLHAYLEAYGERGDLWGITHPTWVEDPTPVLKNLKDYLTQPDDADPAAEMRRRARERDQAVSEARRRLDGYPQPVREQFELLLEAAQTGVVLTEDHGFYIDFRGVYQGRRIILAIGRRLADAGVLARARDAFLLTLDELMETLGRFPALDRRELIEQRRAEMERFGDVRPPAALGTASSGPSPTQAFGRLMGKFLGAPPPDAEEEPGVLRGSAGSPGRAKGRARVIRSIAEAGKLSAGDILVAETTAPPWTPLFASAAAVVTDTGGILSHCAVVAREYGIPAVVGVGVATATIRDGQMIEVDGDAGVVRIEIPA
ncbi:MAG: PEP-utilizing enzyme, partial [Actinomycetota bacterium]